MKGSPEKFRAIAAGDVAHSMAGEIGPGRMDIEPKGERHGSAASFPSAASLRSSTFRTLPEGVSESRPAGEEFPRATFGLPKGAFRLDGKVAVVTGSSKNIGTAIALAFAEAGIDDWQKYVRQDQKFFRPAEVDLLIGDPSKAQTKLGWKREVDFPALVKMMVENDLRLESAKRP